MSNEKMWEAWDTGENPTGYDTYDNEYGKTYCYYSPLYIRDKKVGIVCVEVEIENVYKEILDNTIRLWGMGASIREECWQISNVT